MLALTDAVYPGRGGTDTAEGLAIAAAEGALVLSGSPAIAGKEVRAAFNGGQLISDAGVLPLADIERRLGIAERLANCLTDPRAPERVHHTLAEMIRFRVLLAAAGYPDANDCDALRTDPAFKMALGRAAGRPGARERAGPALAADHVPAREPAHRPRAQAHDGGHGRA